jgi:prevent-host-death family protein
MVRGWYARFVAKKPDTINIAVAKARLPELVERASNGEEIVLSRHGKPKAKLVPIAATRKKYVRGAGRGKWKGIDAILDRPLPRDLLDAFYQSAFAGAEKDV